MPVIKSSRALARVLCGGANFASDGASALIEPLGEYAVRTDILPIVLRFRYHWWRLTHNLFPHDRPRATWAQVIQAFGITDSAELVLHHLDADTIPSGIDVPIQRIRLVDLGYIALFLGCELVEIDVKHWSFRAIGPSCKIGIEEIPTFGQAVRFEGDIQAIHRAKLGLYPEASVIFAVRMIEGRLGAVSAPLSYFNRLCPLRLRLEAEALAVCFTEAGTCLASTSKDSNSEPLQQWQAKMHQIIPSAICGATVASMSSIFYGFPCKTLLDPVLGWCRAEAKAISQDGGLQPGRLSEIASWWRLGIVNHIDKLDDFGTVVVGSRLSPDTSSAIHGRLEWLYKSMPSEERENIFQICPGWSRAANVRIPIMPSCLSLLEDYHPKQWATEFANQGEGGWRPAPVNALWFQILLIDIAIRFQIRGSTKNIDMIEEHGVEASSLSTPIKEGIQMVEAIQASCHPDDTLVPDEQLVRKSDQKPHSYKPWDLHHALERRCNFYNHLSIDDAMEQYKRLSVMLRLRSLFFIAFLAIGPDSSSVYEARNSQVQVPII